MPKYLLIALIASLMFGKFAAAEDIKECNDAGRMTGEVNAKMFCNLLEQSHTRTAYAMRREISLQFCEQRIAEECERGMDDYLHTNRRCADNISNGGYSKWQEAVRTACPRPPVVDCPFPNAQVHRHLWCYNNDNGQFYGLVNGLWWKFQSNYFEKGQKFYYVTYGSGDASSIMRITPDQLTLVQTRW